MSQDRRRPGQDPQTDARIIEQERSLAEGGGAQEGAQGANVLESGQSGRYRGIYHRHYLNYALNIIGHKVHESSLRFGFTLCLTAVPDPQDKGTVSGLRIDQLIITHSQFEQSLELSREGLSTIGFA